MGRLKLLVVLIFFCAVKCFAMSYNELEDFAEYLAKTSQLSPSLKNGAGHFDETEEDEVISDNAWEESGKFEGDLILNERQRRLILQNVADQGLARNGIIDGAKRWPNNEVIFAIQVEHFSNDQVQAILSGIDDLARASCVKFRRYRRGDRDAVVIQGNRRGCFSQVGYQGGFQALNLNSRHPVGRGCFRHGTVVHELLHSLGFYHMQSSPDRDDYVDIIWDNILKASKHNFRKYNTFTVSDFGVGYDYDSVLHYSRKAFSVNGQATIVPKQSGAQIGQRVGLSDKDTEKLNKMYCDADLDGVQTVDDSTDKPTKKSIKNKPFAGQGLGYHKGIAVVFKLLPESESFKLADVPNSHVFDSFSKQPQILSTAQNEDFRTGKKIAYSSKPPALITQEYKEPLYYNTEFDKLLQKEMNLRTGDFVPEIKIMNHPNVRKHVNEEDIPVETLNDDEENPDLIDAFDRLSKIIHSHVYPSQNPDLSIYKDYKNHKNNEELRKMNDYSTSDYFKDSLPEGERTKSTVNLYHDIVPKTVTTSYYVVPVQNKSKQLVTTIPALKDRYEQYIDQTYKRYPDEEIHSSTVRDSEELHNGHDRLLESYKHNPTSDNSKSYFDYLKNLSKEDDYKEDDILKLY